MPDGRFIREGEDINPGCCLTIMYPDENLEAFVNESYNHSPLYSFCFQASRHKGQLCVFVCYRVRTDPQTERHKIIPWLIEWHRMLSFYFSIWFSLKPDWPPHHLTRTVKAVGCKIQSNIKLHINYWLTSNSHGKCHVKRSVMAGVDVVPKENHSFGMTTGPCVVYSMGDGSWHRFFLLLEEKKLK